jgi:hypothetical protein
LAFYSVFEEKIFNETLECRKTKMYCFLNNFIDFCMFRAYKTELDTGFSAQVESAGDLSLYYDFLYEKPAFFPLSDMRKFRVNLM